MGFEIILFHDSLSYTSSLLKLDPVQPMPFGQQGDNILEVAHNLCFKNQF